ncbi:MAG: hypothetical protein ACOX05_04635 [Bacillota bacterium]
MDAVMREVNGEDMSVDAAGLFGSFVHYDGGGYAIVGTNKAANKLNIGGYSPVFMKTLHGEKIIPKSRSFI